MPPDRVAAHHPVEHHHVGPVDLVGDAIDLNRYMEPAAEGAGDDGADSAPTELPSDLIKPLNARGSLKMTSVVLGDLELEQVSLTLNAANGRLRIHPITAGLYGGSYSGDVRIDVAGSEPVLAFDEKVQGVDLAALARAMFEQENITGFLNGNFTLTGRGNDLDKIQRDPKIAEPAYFNFAVTDGHSVVASRCVSDDDVEPQSLYVAKGSRFASIDGVYDMTPADGRVEAVIIASEPLTEARGEWSAVPANHLVSVSPELHVEISPLRRRS